jgi:hypothetical protein
LFKLLPVVAYLFLNLNFILSEAGKYVIAQRLPLCTYITDATVLRDYWQPSVEFVAGC